LAVPDSDLSEEPAEPEPDWLKEPEVPEAPDASELDVSCRPQAASMTVNAPATSAILAALERVLVSIPLINIVHLHGSLTSGCGINYSPYEALATGMFGHGVAETKEDALALIGEAARHLPPESARFFCPLSEFDFFRETLKANCRVIKVMNYMAMGPYEAPNGPCTGPSQTESYARKLCMTRRSEAAYS
jgi:hypothetical protein